MRSIKFRKHFNLQHLFNEKVWLFEKVKPFFIALNFNLYLVNKKLMKAKLLV